MKRLFVFCFVYIVFAIQTSYSQSQIVSEYAEAVTELTGSFLDNPYHHDNTVKINEVSVKFKKALEEMYSNVPLEAEMDFYRIKNMRSIIKCLDFIVANIAGYSRSGMNASEWETTFLPIMSGFGWTWKVLHSTSDIVFYEYTKGDFKMVLAKNIRPKKDEADYNACSFSCYAWQPVYKEHYVFSSRYVFGGNYRFVEYGDDITKYKTITRFSSQRGIRY